MGAWALAACSAPAPDLGPLPLLEPASLGPALEEQLAPVMTSLRSSPFDPTLSGQADMLLQAYGQHGLAVELFERAALLDAGEFRWQYYLGVFRKFQITEKMELQFRAEGFNMTNTPHFERPNSRNVNSSSFMILNRVRNTGREGIDERFFRIGLRLGW